MIRSFRIQALSELRSCTDQLISEKEDSLETELARAEVEKIFETGAEKVENHCVVVALGAKPANKGNADTARQGLVHFALIFELRVLGLDGLKLDGNLLAGDDVGAWSEC